MEYFNHILTGTALLSAFTFLTYQLRNIPSILVALIRRKFFYTLMIDDTNSFYQSFTKWLNENYSHKIMSEKIESCSNLGLEYSPNNFRLLIRYKNTYIFVSATSEKIENANSKFTRFFYKYHLTLFLGKNKIQSIVSEIHRASQTEIEQHNYILRWGGDYWGCGKKITYRKQVFLENKEELIQDIGSFFSTKEWYHKRLITHKRGYMFYGDPGNGKTTFVQELAHIFKKDIYYLNVGAFANDGQLMNALQMAEEGGIFLLEDADVLIPEREETPESKLNIKVSFDTLLNVLDGFLSKEGNIFIMTSNHIEKFDPAIIREGRIDVKVKFENPKKEIVEQYISNFYEKELILSKYNKNYSMAKIQELCLINKNDSEKLISVLEE